jgi:hypothetical protein
MFRQVEIDIDSSTWPMPPAKPAFPPSFHAGILSVPINIPALLLTIGVLTTPAEPIGPTLSQYWAFVRYLSAITSGPDLRITQAFASLDSHQKTILSDDFGMGIPMSWLFGVLNPFGFCDGRYFITKLAASVGATVPKLAARGPNKSPDFVLLDTRGDWHVVECKGTQGRPGYRDKQLGDPQPNATGGIAQKHAIVFPASNTGQRLACGVAIGAEGETFNTNLRIVDPERPPLFTVAEGWLADAKEVVSRGMLARALRLAGFEAAATYIAANGPAPKAGIRPRFRLERLEHLRRVAETELRGSEPANRTVFLAGERQFVGRQMSLNPSRQSDIAGQVSMTQGLTLEFIEQLLALDVSEQRRDHLAPEIMEAIYGVHLLTKSERKVSLEIGKAFQIEMTLGTRSDTGQA